MTSGMMVDRTSGSVVQRVTVASTTYSGVPSGKMPLSISESQLYYWTTEWQRGEVEALEDLSAGRSRTFTDPKEMAAYLLSNEH